MITQNYYNALKGLLNQGRSGRNSIAPIRLYGGLTTSWCTANNPPNVAILTGIGLGTTTTTPLITPDTATSTSTTNRCGWVIGSGTTEESISDYTLANPINITNLTTTITNTYNADGSVTRVFNILNNKSETIEINEVGYCGMANVFIGTSSTSTTSHYCNCLFYREVLDETVVIEPGQVGQLTINAIAIDNV